jgi:hypothetical protein
MGPATPASLGCLPSPPRPARGLLRMTLQACCCPFGDCSPIYLCTLSVLPEFGSERTTLGLCARTPLGLHTPLWPSTDTPLPPTEPPCRPAAAHLDAAAQNHSVPWVCCPNFGVDAQRLVCDAPRYARALGAHGARTRVPGQTHNLVGL